MIVGCLDKRKGSFLPVPELDVFGESEPSISLGEVLTPPGEILEINKGRSTAQLSVTNMGDRPIQVCVCARARVGMCVSVCSFECSFELVCAVVKTKQPSTILLCRYLVLGLRVSLLTRRVVSSSRFSSDSFVSLRVCGACLFVCLFFSSKGGLSLPFHRDE